MFPIIRFKACPKCKGDLALEKDQYGNFWSCQQCGFLIEVRPKERGNILLSITI